MCSNKYPPVITPSSFHFQSEDHGTNNIPFNVFNLPKGSLPSNPYGVWGCYTLPNPILLTPAIFGGLSAFALGFRFFGYNLTTGYSKFIFFINIYAIVATLGVGYYIYQAVYCETGGARYLRVIIPIIMVAVFYATAYNLTYSLYPNSFSGIIGDTHITQFVSFLSKSLGVISVGERFEIAAQSAGSQMLTALETVFNLLIITLLISLLAN